MKVRSSPITGRTVIESENREDPLPPIPAADIHLKRILVPVDFSECSRKALQYAISIAKQFGAEIDIIHVLSTPPYFEAPVPAVATEYERSRHETVSRQLSEWRKEVPCELTVRATVRNGSPYNEIVRAADDTNADLVIIGSRGRSGLGQVLIGSTAERVVRHAPCPVLTVREREHDFVQTQETHAKTE